MPSALCPASRPAVVVTLLVVAASGGVGGLAAQESCIELPELVEFLDPLSQDGEWLGASVAVDGGVAVVGVPRDQEAGFGTGRVLVYERGPMGWVLTARLRDDVVRLETEFGGAVDVEGDLIAVGAHADDVADADAGAVHLFRRQADGTWLHAQRLQASDAFWTDLFGSSIALDGGTLAVGAREAKNASVPLAPSGAAYLFEDDGTGQFVETARVTAPVPQAVSWFGFSVALDGGVLIVGEPRRHLGSRAYAGAAYAFARQLDGSWAWEADLTTADQEAGANSGFDVAIEDGLVAVGLHSRGGPVRSWRRGALGSWALQHELSRADPLVSGFGSAVTLASGRLVVAARQSRRPLGALVYAPDGLGGWSLVEELVPSDGGLGLSRSLDFDGQHLILGASDHRHGSSVPGGAWLFGCDPAPNCDAGPETLSADCDGLRLNGSADDPLGRALSAWWSTDCPDLLFSPSADRLDPWVMLDSACERECSLTLEVTAEDGTACSDTLILSIDDDRPPQLTVPSSATLECSSEGGVPASDPLVAAWLESATALDACGGVVITSDAPAVFSAACFPGLATRVRFTARDDCGNETLGESELIVVDTTPPVVEPGREILRELWAPNHRWLTVTAGSLSPPGLSDLCDLAPPAWRFALCRSDEAVDGLGDGHTEPDCMIAADGQSVALRAERSGRGEGRLYELSITASDSCGNTSDPVPIGSVRVRHDQRR